MKIERNLLYILFSELIFTILPLIVISIVRSYQDKVSLIFYNVEWSMMAIILFGQSIIKFSSGISNSKKQFRWQLVALIISLIITIGLIPSIVILVINSTNDNQSLGLHIFQIILFILSTITFFLIGYIGQKLIEEK
ncbi:hypothetical protein [Elizabethkingia anophelis]|uniref:hypothetical protein n=1 Tax=Elizabethkingia anophelis TaxID=1117645 RepID=UPI0008400B22|nr:hypothetical protein [Elizabethkingia anophelis]MCT3803338.1 hypothetical protein [Elizabethkingia anophelis]MCT3982162.1 hypothetical protein [Elizabethkingia anophelis]MCT4060169.1 hypothetical protein [Elizabethkingia anophelis]MCT4070860.1 hypothetical protein [Elizabethkingia anophelis]MCT4120811.1 hypothetical protein [Elizabethkingia anophelis]